MWTFLDLIWNKRQKEVLLSFIELEKIEKAGFSF